MWLAGFYEGEGSIGFHTRDGGGSSLRIAQHVRDKELLDKCVTITQMGKVYISKTKPVAVWTVTGVANIYKLAKQLYPHLGSRRQGQLIRAIGEIENTMKFTRHPELFV